MKNLILILLFIVAPFSFFGQSLTGLWMGNLTNDSNSVRQEQSFEIVLTQYKEKVYGYSRNTFIVNDTLYYIVKRVKGSIVGDVCEVKDDYIVSHNFPKKPEKGVKVTSVFIRNKVDSTWSLDGDWKTKKTKKYYSVSGKVDLKEEKDLTASKLFPHLEELGLEKDMPVFVEAKLAAAAAVAKTNPVPIIDNSTGPKPSDLKSSPNSIAAVTKDKLPDVKKSDVPVTQKPVTDIAANVPGKDVAKTSAGTTTVIEEKKPVVDGAITTAQKSETSPQKNNNTATPTTAIAEEKKATNTNTTDQVAFAKNNTPVKQPATEQKPAAATEQPILLEDLGNTPVKSNPASQKPNTTATTNKQSVDQTVAEKKPAAIKNNETATVTPVNAPPKITSDPTSIQKTFSAPATARVSERKTEAPQYVNYVSDSLILILYDNGEIDGDTVSVFLNGKMFMEKQGLKTSAIRKTVHITPGNEELTLILFAENLGKYPPNTGLLVVYDGEERHQLRFSADFQKNASVVFRRKK